MGLHMLGKLRTHLTKLGFGIFLVIVAMPGKSQAQVVPDGTLKSAVEQMQELMKINGGIREGNNLFHSFQEFSVPEGVEASFQNALDIENIFTRVTGDSVSNIDGILSAQGGANLFLMNPNGIVFGQNASINIGGSFIATTADSIQFGDGIEFTANPSDEPPLLTNHIPIGLGFGSKKYSGNGAIEVNGAGNVITPTSPSAPTEFESNKEGLQVEAGNTLGLIGNDISIDAGTLVSERGNIDIQSVKSGVVGIVESEGTFTFSNDNVSIFGDINLANQTIINSRGIGAGAISLSGSNINIKGGSLVLSQNQGSNEANNISIKAQNALTFEGASPAENTFSNVTAEALDKGKGASVFVSASDLILNDAGKILANTYGEGSGGSINIVSSKSVQLAESPFASFPFISASAYDRGNAGSVNISTQQLEVLNGGQVASATFGNGDAGNVRIDANSSINLVGAKKLPSQDAPVVSTITSGTVSSGNAGTVMLNTSSLRVIDGGLISTSSFTSGNAGNITINADELVTVSGQTSDGKQESTIGSSVVAVAPELQAIFGLSEPPSGNSGNVTITTSNLQVDSKGFVSVRNDGTGAGGTLSVDADNIKLDEEGSLTATSASATSGNIILNTDNLNLDDESQITTEAANEGGGGNININATNITAKKNSLISANAEGGNGGNITIDSETILGLQNSDITANAVEGDGGNINITTRTIQGFEEQAELTPRSDITASSEFGRSGTVTINSPETNSEEDVELSAKGVESVQSLEFFSACGKGKGSLTRTGMGVPENPDRWFNDVDSVRVYEEAKKTVQAERIKQGLRNGSPEEVYRRELELIRSRRNKSGNRHNYLAYEVDYAKGSEPMIVPAPKGEFVQPEGYSEHTPNGKPIPFFYSQTNEVPPEPRVTRLRKEPNIVQINPDGTQYFIRMTLAQDVKEQMCTDAQQVIKVGQ